MMNGQTHKQTEQKRLGKIENLLNYKNYSTEHTNMSVPVSEHNNYTILVSHLTGADVAEVRDLVLHSLVNWLLAATDNLWRHRQHTP